ncbi:MAG: UDP-4-amino-4,6-dideoxy-N-acetyl-beta-L-altrosamine transaminase [Roseburia sp.]|nr:UDP-4-amino-4,6-dideoxy-N-acetyl-beta-L-altrosamine transaminase [Roseburia sp.]
MDKLAIFGGNPVRENPIYYGHQFVDEKDIAAVADVLKSDFLTCGPEITRLEKKLCEITGAKYAVAVSNGTAALHASCFAAGIGQGDEVITTPITFAASSNCVLYCKGTPVFADIQPDTYNISPAEIQNKITDKTKAVIAVDFTGQAAELREIQEICRKRNLVFIEDGAHSIGTLYDGKYVGNVADMTTFSFHPVKTVTGGEGGAVLTNNEDFYQKLLLFRAHGITRNEGLMECEPEGDWYYEQIELGYNYRITDMQAALISSQLDKLFMFKQRRKEIVSLYDEAFSGMPEIIVQKEIKESDTTRHLYIIQLVLERLKGSRKEIFDALKAENVCCNVHYMPVYYLPYYSKLGYEKGICPKAEFLYDRIISIPLFYSMTNEDVESVICAVKKVIQYYRI